MGSELYHSVIYNMSFGTRLGIMQYITLSLVTIAGALKTVLCHLALATIQDNLWSVTCHWCNLHFVTCH